MTDDYYLFFLHMVFYFFYNVTTLSFNFIHIKNLWAIFQLCKAN